MRDELESEGLRGVEGLEVQDGMGLYGDNLGVVMDIGGIKESLRDMENG